MKEFHEVSPTFAGTSAVEEVGVVTCKSLDTLLIKLSTLNVRALLLDEGASSPNSAGCWRFLELTLPPSWSSRCKPDSNCTPREAILLSSNVLK